MIEVLTAILSEIGDAFIGTLTENLAQEVKFKLEANFTKNAFKQALGAAIQDYASSGFRLDFARPLLEKDSFLIQPAVASELTQLVRFEREPNAVLIGQRWKTAMNDPPPWADFTYEAKNFLGYLKALLCSTEVLRPVFATKSLDAIAVSTVTSATSLTHIEAQLRDLVQLMNSGFTDLTRAFAGASFNLREQIRDYTRYIQEKTHDFVGRQFVFDAVTHFTDTQLCGYFFIRGDPGIGKSALAAQMVKTHGYVHHFNIRYEGINTTEIFLRNICAQLIVVYQLNHSFLPPEAAQDGKFLNRLLEEVSEKLGPAEKSIIVIDALDEVDRVGLPPYVNTLYLPVTLPQGIYVVLTTRKMPIDLRVDGVGSFDIGHDSESSIADIQEYVSRAITRPGIKAYIAAQGIDNELFIERLVEKSESNFMYLRYVLYEIERGAFRDLGLERLPAGLQNYYNDQWRRMRGEDKKSWVKYKLPVIMALAAVKEPVSIEMLVNFSGVQERLRIYETLQEWRQFLLEEVVTNEGKQQNRYQLYHASFRDFIATKEGIEGEDVSLKDAHKKIVEYYWSKFVLR